MSCDDLLDTKVCFRFSGQRTAVPLQECEGLPGVHWGSNQQHLHSRKCSSQTSLAESHNQNWNNHQTDEQRRAHRAQEEKGEVQYVRGKEGVEIVIVGMKFIVIGIC